MRAVRDAIARDLKKAPLGGRPMRRQDFVAVEEASLIFDLVEQDVQGSPNGAERGPPAASQEEGSDELSRFLEAVGR